MLVIGLVKTTIELLIEGHVYDDTEYKSAIHQPPRTLTEKARISLPPFNSQPRESSLTTAQFESRTATCFLTKEALDNWVHFYPSLLIDPAASHNRLTQMPPSIQPLTNAPFAFPPHSQTQPKPYAPSKTTTKLLSPSGTSTVPVAPAKAACSSKPSTPFTIPVLCTTASTAVF